MMWKPSEKYIKIPEFLSISKDSINKLLENHSKEGDLVLDVGCGYGKLSKHLSTLGRRVIAIDTNEEVIENLKKEGVNAKVMNAMDLEYDDDSIDLVITDGLFEHFENNEDIKKIVKEQVRVAKGYVINIVPRDIPINVILEKLQFCPKEYRDKDWIAIFKSVVGDKYEVQQVDFFRISAYIIKIKE